MKHNNDLPFTASLVVTENCNLACTYCFELGQHSEKKMSTTVAKDTLDYLANNAIAIGENKFDATLFGGEPLMNLETCKFILEYGHELAQKHNLEFHTTIITNGTILNDEAEAILRYGVEHCHLNAQLSVDGMQDMHDFYRITKNGKPSFHLIEKNVPLFKDIFKNSISVHSVINKMHLPKLHDSYRFFRDDWGIDQVWFMPLHEEEWEPEHMKIYREQLELIKEDVVQEVKDKDSSRAINTYSPLSRCFNHHRADAPCGAGKTYVSVNTDGDIHPCHHFYFNHHDDFKIGSIYDGIDDMKRAIFLDYDSDSLSCPSSCEQVNCYRCPAANFDYNGNMLSQIRGGYCGMSKTEGEVMKEMKDELIKSGYTPQGKLHFVDQVDFDKVEFDQSWIQDGIYYEQYKHKGSTNVSLFTQELEEFNERERLLETISKLNQTVIELKQEVDELRQTQVEVINKIVEKLGDF